MNKSAFTLFILLIAITGYAQEEVSTSTHKLTLSSSQLIVTSASHHGIIIVDLNPIVDNNTAVLNISKYDTTWNQTWETKIPIHARSGLVYYKYIRENFYLIFQEHTTSQIQVVTVDVQSGYYHPVVYSIPKGFKVKDLEAYQNSIWVSGLINNQGIIYKLDESESSYKILPVGHSEPIFDIAEMHFDDKSSTLQFSMVTSARKNQTYIHRIVNEEGKVVENLLIEPEISVQLTGLKVVYKDGLKYCTGLYYKPSANKPKGVFLHILKNGQLMTSRYIEFKEALGKGSFYQFQNQPNSESIAPDTKKSRKEVEEAIIDNLIVDDHGPLIVIETVDRNFRTKSYLKQEIEKQALVNQIDQNAFGRRDMDATSSGQTIEDRIDNYSGTDIQQYMYRDAIVGQPVFEGYVYNQTVVLKYSNDLSIVAATGIEMPIKDSSFAGLTNSYNDTFGLKMKYPGGNFNHNLFYDPGSKSFKKANRTPLAPGSLYFKNWYDDIILGYQLEQIEDQFQLTLYRID